MTAEVKIRTLAQSDATLAPYFGTGASIRWFDRQMPPGYIDAGPCVRMLRVSTKFGYTMLGQTKTLSGPLFQFDVLSKNAETARAAAGAIIAWLSTISLANNNQFNSVVTTPPQFPCFLLNQRAGMDYELSNVPVYVESLDVRFYNLET